MYIFYLHVYNKARLSRYSRAVHTLITNIRSVAYNSLTHSLTVAYIE